jgi:hypothetical protein
VTLPCPRAFSLLHQGFSLLHQGARSIPNGASQAIHGQIAKADRLSVELVTPIDTPRSS